MKIYKKALSGIVVMCRTLDIVIGVIYIPVTLLHTALEAMSRRTDGICDNLREEIKRI